MATGAEPTAEGDFCSGVDGDTVVLVVDLRPINDNVGAGSNVKTIGVVAALSVTGGIVNDHVGDGQAIASVDADCLDRRVQDVQIGDGR